MNKEILKKAINHYGESHQIKKAREELLELYIELKLIKDHLNAQDRSNFGAIDGLVDEVADVSIMLEQLKIIFDCKSQVDDRIEFKLDRLEKRINDKNT